jgi:hypothetical protein
MVLPATCTGSVYSFPKSAQWNSLQMLSGITSQDLYLESSRRDEVHDIIWGDLCSEYDAEHFCQYLRQSQIPFTPEFQAFETLWRQDELNHYQGFRQIYALLFQQNPKAIEDEMTTRTPNFKDLKEFLQDEFSICVVIAYDELATARTYPQDFKLYASFGPAPVGKWLKYVARDEGLHYDNALQIIARCHRHRLAELPALINRLVEFNVEDNHHYNATFLLNHEQNCYFSADFLAECGHMICKRFGF